MNKRSKQKIEVLEIIVAVVIIILVFMIISGLTGMQKTARVINYTGLIRGGTQQLVKLELMEKPNQELEAKLSGWITELQTGVGDTGLVIIENDEYQGNMRELAEFWGELRKDIDDVRQGGSKEILLNDSETYFVLANDLVSSAENYSSIQSVRLKIQVYILLMAAIVLAVALAVRTWKSITLERKIGELDAIAHADTTTKLPNRTSCDEIVREHNTCKSCVNHGAVMFDLNNLKITNDKYGHKAGDALLANFAKILSDAGKNRCFVGRWGGDEFIAIFEDGRPQVIDDFIQDIKKAAEAFNKKDTLVNIDYAFGYCLTEEENMYSLEQMIAIADKRMYEQKAAMKKGRTA